MLRTEAIRNFLLAKTVPDLANLYSIDMECQVNVAQDGGERVEGDYKGRQWHGWTDGVQQWKSFRIPYNANSKPEYVDVKINFDLAVHAEGIGMTGWDWKNRLSKWVAYDFDSIAGHSPKAQNTMSDAELKEVQNTAKNIEWVTVRYSASGRGLHLYVELNPPVRTENHNEHASLARSILGKMSALTGYDFNAKVDACGGNMWVWHRKMAGTEGLKLIKKGIPLNTVPDNWRDHIKVVIGKRKKNLPKFVEDSEISNFDKVFEELTGQRNSIALDETHKKLISWLDTQEKYVWWWDSDNHMLVTHTCALVDAYTELNCKGVFETNSEGTDPKTQNCFLYPLNGGGWVVRRFTPGIQEAVTWEQDVNGWTRCYYNVKPDLFTASRTYEGIEHEKGGFIFRQAEMAMKAAQSIGVDLEIPNWAVMRQTRLKQHKDGRLVAELKREDTDSADSLRGWLPEKSVWKRIFNKSVELKSEHETINYDSVLRHLVTSEGDDQGWSVFSDGVWRNEPLSHVRVALKSTGLNVSELDNVLGSSIFNCWKVVNRPFQSEYPGDRCWNLNAAQFRFTPSVFSDTLRYPTWTKILEHCGSGLNESVKENTWAKSNGIVSGADYLKCWVASLFQEPTEPLPYLFLYGPQNSGKSILHEALSLLLTKGYQRADNCLGAKTEFNGELEGAIICVVEETDLNKNRVAYNKIKDWVTSRHINIRHLYRSPYHVVNTTHWIHCANDASACPVFSGDTRITMTYVGEITNHIPKKLLIPMLEREASDFLASLLSLELPVSDDRLNIPVITTSDKEMIQNQNKTTLETFIDENCYYVQGEMISVKEFFDKFVSWVDPSEIHEWSKIRIGKELPSTYPKGRRSFDGHHYIGNISFDKIEPTKPLLIVRNGKLLHIGDNDELL